MNKDNRTVNHVTRIILHLLDDPIPFDIIEKAEAIGPDCVRQFAGHLQNRLERVAAMMELLAAKGFVFQYSKNCICAESEVFEAQETKKYLLENGFRDREFQVWLEYTRKWGMM